MVGGKIRSTAVQHIVYNGCSKCIKPLRPRRTLYNTTSTSVFDPIARFFPHRLHTGSASPQYTTDGKLTTALSLMRLPQLIRPTQRHPSLSTILTLLSHPPIATHRPPGAHVTVLIPIPGSSPALSEKEGEDGEKWVRQGPRGE